MHYKELLDSTILVEFIVLLVLQRRQFHLYKNRRPKSGSPERVTRKVNDGVHMDRCRRKSGTFSGLSNSAANTWAT